MLKLFSGTSNPTLSEQVAQAMGMELSPVEVVRFDNSEVRVRIETEVKNDVCAIIQPVSNPTDTNLMELFFMCDALRREEARKVIGVVPYFGYARQNIQHRPGENVSANVVIRFWESIGFHKIYTVDIHDEGTSGVFSIPFKNLSAFPDLANAIKGYVQTDTPSDQDFAVASPDQGGIERARKFGIAFFGHENFHMAVTEKKRDMETIHKSKAMDTYGDVSNKTVIIVDDIATSAGTLVHSAEQLMERGAKRVLAVVTHHDFSTTAPEKIQNSPIEVFFTTNTIALKPEFSFPKLHEISIANLIAEELKHFKE